MIRFACDFSAIGTNLKPDTSATFSEMMHDAPRPICRVAGRGGAAG